MPPEAEMLHISKHDMEMREKHAVIESKMEDYDNVIPQIHSTLTAMDRAISAIPARITECKDQMDRDVKDYMHKRFITDVDILALEQKIERKVEKLGAKINMGTWIVSGFITAGVFLIWIITNTNITIT